MKKSFGKSKPKDDIYNQIDLNFIRKEKYPKISQLSIFKDSESEGFCNLNDRNKILFNPY